MNVVTGIVHFRDLSQWIVSQSCDREYLRCVVWCAVLALTLISLSLYTCIGKIQDKKYGFHTQSNISSTSDELVSV